MCLILEDTTKYIANTDIIVYKVVAITDNKMHAIWRPFRYKYNKLYKLSRRLRIYKLFDVNSYTMEGFYSFNNLQDAELLKLKYINSSSYVTKVVKCTLPKGTEYYTSNNVIVSNQIKIIEDVLHNK